MLSSALKRASNASSSKFILSNAEKCAALHTLHTCSLGSGKTTSVHSIIDVGINIVVRFVDLLPESSGVQVEFGVFSKLIELRVEHPDDLGALVVDDGALDLVPEDGNGGTAVVFGVGLEVKVADAGGVVDGIRGVDSRVVLSCSESPGALS
jgi:hypothetical protein